ncbi:PIN domain-like protein [Halteromyces radiatus]|uniref:PIN domain-like protein n=1 Tax=Halteromyces radiatus TaxID=101107 RepID=UPI00221FF8D2|nr:PIN domain-like protein [Halteromyces radiatus]KAI8076846.1 PIN domain-like protein [Halteromyces radiatus]
MGIQGLLPLFDKVQQKVNIKEYSGCRVAVDGNVWLHRGAFACAKELALNQPTTGYVNYFKKQVEFLQYHKVEPVIVFDGEALPIKKHTNDQRRLKRQIARDQAMDYLRHGNLHQATDCFQKAIQITPHMTKEVIKYLELNNIKYIHAPYEADAQLAFLCQTGLVSAVITEDSDLLVFGCPTVLLKMNAYGDAVQIRQKDIFQKVNQDIDFTNWNLMKLRHMCILSGCDYLPSIPGVGIKTAYKLFNRYQTISKVLYHLQRQRKLKISPDYEHNFFKANDAFLFQYVYNPLSKNCTRLNKLPTGKTYLDYDFLGDSPNDEEPTLKVQVKSVESKTSSSSRFPSMVTSSTSSALPLRNIQNQPSTTLSTNAVLPKKYSSMTETAIYDENNKENIPPWITMTAVTQPNNQQLKRKYDDSHEQQHIKPLLPQSNIISSNKKRKTSLALPTATESLKPSFSRTSYTHPQVTSATYISLFGLCRNDLSSRKRKLINSTILSPTDVLIPSMTKRFHVTH